MSVSERGIAPTSIMLILLYVNIIDVSLRESNNSNINKVEAFNSLSDNDNIVSRWTVMRREYSCMILSTTLTRLVITSGMRREKMSLRTSFFTVEITLVREVPTD